MNEFIWIAQNVMGCILGFFLFLVLVLLTMICIIKFKELMNRN